MVVTSEPGVRVLGVTERRQLGKLFFAIASRQHDVSLRTGSAAVLDAGDARRPSRTSGASSRPLPQRVNLYAHNSPRSKARARPLKPARLRLGGQALPADMFRRWKKAR
jgi:hypothetical protein